MKRVLIACAAIAFSSFWTPLIEAADPVPVTDSPAADRHPTWSADGSFIVFESNRSGSGWHLYRTPASGGDATQLSFDANSQLAPEISPDGSTIVFVQAVAAVSNGGFNSSAICLMPVGGGASTTLVPNDGAFRWHPTWSPDGSTIYYDRRSATNDVYKVSAGGGPETFVLDRGDDLTQTVSPDGTTLTFASRTGPESYNLFQVPLANPTQNTQLNYESQNTSEPDYSPDGSTIAFASRKTLGRLEIYQISVTSHEITRLTFDAENSPFDPVSQFPTYSPDGQKLAFCSARIAGNENVWVLPLVDIPPPPENMLTLEGGSGLPGPGTVTLPISLASNVSTPALEFEILDVPDWLQAVRVVPRLRAAALTASFADNAGTHIVLYATSGVSLPPGEGPILDLVMTVKPNAVENDSTVLTFANIIMADPLGQPVSVSSQGAVVHIERKAGDVNGDGLVDTGDLVRLVEIILGTGAPPTSAELAEADCNEDGSQNALDVVCLLDDVLSKAGPSASFATIPAGTWTLWAEEPVLGIQGFASGDAWSSSGTDLAPFTPHQGSASLIAFNAQGAAWSSGQSRTFNLASSIGLRAFGVGGRALPVRVEGSEIHIGTPLPAGLHVLPASPNPFARSTEIAFSVDTATTVRVHVYDVRGAKVSEMGSRSVAPGRQVWQWSALDDRGEPLPSGLYVAVVEAGGSRRVVRLTHLR